MRNKYCRPLTLKLFSQPDYPCQTTLSLAVDPADFPSLVALPIVLSSDGDMEFPDASYDTDDQGVVRSVRFERPCSCAMSDPDRADEDIGRE